MRLVLAVIVAIVGLVAREILAKDVDPLALPLSPGSVALLVERGAEPAVQERWRAALKDERPQVRAASARVIHAAAASSLISDLAAAIAVEADGNAAAEEAWALAALDPSRPSGDMVIAAATRLPQMSRARVLLSLASGDRAQFLARWKEIAAVELGDEGWRELLGHYGYVVDTGLATLAPTILRDGPVIAWRALLDVVSDNTPIAAGLLTVALASSSPETRTAAYFYLVRRQLIRIEPVSLAIPEAEPSDSMEALGRGLYLRFSGKSEPKLIPLLEAFPSAPLARRFLERSLMREQPLLALADEERAGLARLLSSRVSPSPVEPTSPVVQVAPNRPPELPTRTVGGYPQGFVADVMSASGCERPNDEAAAWATVARASSGRPTQVSYERERLKGGCSMASRALIAASLTRGGFTGSERVVLPMNPRFLACLEEHPPERESLALRVGDAVQAARNIDHKTPAIPVHRSSGRWTVAVRILISPTGCASHARIVGTGGDFEIDRLIMSAITRAAYTPTRVHGEGVATFAEETMTITRVSPYAPRP